jgi:hypothetical protein
MLRKSFLDDQEGFFVHWVGQITLVAMSFVMRNNSYLLLILLMLLSLCPLAWSEVRRMIFIENWRTNQVFFLDFMILHMKTGLTLKESAKKLCFSQKGTQKNVLRMLCEVLEIQNINQEAADLPQVIKNFFEEIKIVDRNPSKKLENIVKLRSHYRMMQDFKLRASSAVMQSRAQSIVVAVMFVACMAYSISINPEFVKSQPFAAALLLFLVGGYWLFKMGAKTKWKV